MSDNFEVIVDTPNTVVQVTINPPIQVQVENTAQIEVTVLVGILSLLIIIG